MIYHKGLQTTARGPDAAREAISSGPRSHFVNDEKIIHSTYEKLVDLVEYNIANPAKIALRKTPGPRHVLFYLMWPSHKKVWRPLIY